MLWLSQILRIHLHLLDKNLINNILIYRQQGSSWLNIFHIQYYHNHNLLYLYFHIIHFKMLQQNDSVQHNKYHFINYHHQHIIYIYHCHLVDYSLQSLKISIILYVKLGLLSKVLYQYFLHKQYYLLIIYYYYIFYNHSFNLSLILLNNLQQLLLLRKYHYY